MARMSKRSKQILMQSVNIIYNPVTLEPIFMSFSELFRQMLRKN